MYNRRTSLKARRNNNGRRDDSGKRKIASECYAMARRRGFCSGETKAFPNVNLCHARERFDQKQKASLEARLSIAGRRQECEREADVIITRLAPCSGMRFGSEREFTSRCRLPGIREREFRRSAGMAPTKVDFWTTHDESHVTCARIRSNHIRRVAISKPAALFRNGAPELEIRLDRRRSSPDEVPRDVIAMDLLVLLLARELVE